MTQYRQAREGWHPVKSDQGWKAPISPTPALMAIFTVMTDLETQFAGRTIRSPL